MTHIRDRRGTAAQWLDADPILRLGEVGWETDTRKAKIGDGVNEWSSLPYAYSDKADLDSPTFTGDPKAPTPATSDNDTSIATTAYVKSNISGLAPLASPTFTGDPKAPTPLATDSDTSIATTGFVKAQNYAPLVSPTFTGDPKAPTPLSSDNDTSIATTAFVKTAINGLAPTASPVFTGDPKAPTPVAGDNDASIATTSFVQSAIATPPATSAPSFATNWGQFGSGFENVSYYKFGGRVYLQGLAIRTTSASTVGETIFILPVGYRPSATVVFVISSAGAAVTLYVTSAGLVSVQSVVAVNNGVSFSGVNFRHA